MELRLTLCVGPEWVHVCVAATVRDRDVVWVPELVGRFVEDLLGLWVTLCVLEVLSLAVRLRLRLPVPLSEQVQLHARV